MKDPYSVILKPIVTEKGTDQISSLNKYPFRVDVSANKTDIKYAVEQIFKVKVANVHTMNRVGKKKRVRAIAGYTAAWKKAIVTLKAGDKIEMIG